MLHFRTPFDGISPQVFLNWLTDPSEKINLNWRLLFLLLNITICISLFYWLDFNHLWWFNSALHWQRNQTLSLDLLRLKTELIKHHIVSRHHCVRTICKTTELPWYCLIRKFFIKTLNNPGQIPRSTIWILGTFDVKNIYMK